MVCVGFFSSFQQQLSILKKPCASLKWPVRGIYACRNVTFELTVQTEKLKKTHADSA